MPVLDEDDLLDDELLEDETDLDDEEEELDVTLTVGSGFSGVS